MVYELEIASPQKLIISKTPSGEMQMKKRTETFDERPTIGRGILVDLMTNINLWPSVFKQSEKNYRVTEHGAVGKEIHETHFSLLEAILWID